MYTIGGNGYMSTDIDSVTASRISYRPGTQEYRPTDMESLSGPLRFDEVPTLENSFAYPPGITGTSTTQDKLAQLPTNFETEVDPLSDEPCIPENGLEGEPQTFLCPMCCEKQFSLVDLQQHISRYIWGSLKCPVCDEVCVGLEILAVHLDEHHSYQEMLVPEIRLWTNEDKVNDTAEESVNVSCGDVTGLDLENTAQQTTSQLQSTDSVSSDIETNDNYYLSVMADSSCAPDTHMSGVEQNSATSSENVSTSSTCEIENCVEALRGVNSNLGKQRRFSHRSLVMPWEERPTPWNARQ
uniref:Uncharacterized protein n=1 Tax=Timema douglasi TaxID=61478 RepID=A0A7R8VMX1_TIMDO|nr:unnamed protein product [Timema douglasi]